jgi:hypothetical protein
MQRMIRQGVRNVKRWPWLDGTWAAGMMAAQAGFRRLKAHRQLPALRRALADHLESTG